MATFPRVLHGGVDAVAMWTEDLRPRTPRPFRPAPAAPLGCFGALPPLPPPPDRAGAWRPPSPRTGGSVREDRMTVHVMPSAGPRRGTAVLVPPWKIGSPALVAGYVSLLRRAGLDVWLAVPPHHADRAGAGERSGEGFVSPDLGHLRATFEQLVLEIRTLLAVAGARGGEVGLVGVSLGALAAALAATAPGRLDFAALVAPPDLGDVLARTPIGRRYRRLADRAGVPVPAAEALAPMLAPFRAAARSPSARRTFVAAGTYDRIVPPPGPAALAHAWGVVPRLYPRGHMTLLFACRALRRDLASFVAAGGPRPDPLGGPGS